MFASRLSSFVGQPKETLDSLGEPEYARFPPALQVAPPLPPAESRLDEEMPPEPRYSWTPSPASSYPGDPTTNASEAVTPGWLGSFFREPRNQLFGVVLLLFVLTAVLGMVNFCIWYFEKKRRRGPVHWRSTPIGDITLGRPTAQPHIRSFHIQHALYKTVRRPSSMPP